MLKIATALAATLVAFGAHAATVTFSFDNLQATTEINQNGSLGLFDSSLGTLTAIDLLLNGGMTTTLTLTNTAATAVRANATVEVDLSFASTIANLNTLLGNNAPELMLLATTGFQNYGASGSATASATFGPLTSTGIDDINSGLVLADFMAAGGGNFGISCASLSGLTLVGGGGNLSSLQTSTAGCGATITYTYTPAAQPPVNVPEPGSLALVGVALAGIALAARRKA
ncbi:MAG: PEP-CTERM sorting domain-containing protein [Burkholderiales bacterium]|nr:PEP-CTERM sorting domain-containing protein [Burkholderiales bacterium]